MRKRRGYNLIQMMMANAMMAVLAGAFTFVFFVCNKNYNYQRQRMALRESAIWGLENISQDLRKARSFTLGAASSITFASSPYETVNYAITLVSAGVYRLIRTYTTTSAVATSAANNVSAFTLQYYNSAGTALSVPVSAANLANIRLVRITLALSYTSTLGTDTLTLRTQVRPRNL